MFSNLGKKAGSADSAAPLGGFSDFLNFFVLTFDAPIPGQRMQIHQKSFFKVEYTHIWKLKLLGALGIHSSGECINER